jgi:hypothetical protein
VLTLLAEMATRRGDASVAEKRFLSALALDPKDSYLLGAYADFLLDQGRPLEVVKLVRDQSRIDALLLRHALALQALQQLPGSSSALELVKLVEELNQRFNAAMQRGDTVHQREQARFALYLQQDPATALVLAQKNWIVQKETADLRIYLEAALKAGASAAPIMEWIKTNKLEDVTIAKLARQLKAGS